MPATVTIPYSALSSYYHPVFLAYLTDGLPSCFRYDFRSRDVLIRKAREASRRRMAVDVVQAIRQYALEIAAPGPAMENLRRLEEGNACVVITGQQPGLGTGPLYTIYKAITAIRVARWLTEQAGVTAVPLFWNHSDDHDRSEIRALTLFHGEEGLKTIRLEMDAPQAPIYTLSCREAVDAVHHRILEALPPTDFRPEVAALLERTRHDRPALWFSRLLSALFGNHGLIVVEPRLLDSPVTDAVYRRVLQDSEGVQDAFQRGRRAVADHGLPDQLGDVGLNLFSISDGKRFRVHDVRTVQGRLSAGAGLRLIVQDAVFPTVATVAGPNELAYCAELGPLYEMFGIDPPIFFPRVSATLIEARINRVMEKGGVTVEGVLGSKKIGIVSPNFQGKIQVLQDEIERKISALAGEAASKPDVQTARDKTVRKIREALETFRVRLAQSYRQGEISEDQWRRIESRLCPQGHLQERGINILSFLNLRGMAWLDELTGQLDPFCFDHQVIRIE